MRLSSIDHSSRATASPYPHGERGGIMKTASHLSWFLATLVSMALVFSPALSAQEQSAGQISREFPSVNIQHGSKLQPASAGSRVLWGDLVTTDRGGRARITLDDGSILNVGSDSQLRVIQHDAANQRTQIQLAYGRLRASAVHLSHAGSSFEVRTPTAVAGVVGTEFDLEFTNSVSSLQVYEGSVTFCNLTGQCVTVAAGFSSIVRGNEAPSQPAPTSPTTAAQNVQSTSLGGTDGVTGTGATAGGIVGTAGPSEGAIVRGATLQQGANVFSGDVVEVGPAGEGVVSFGHNAMARFSEQTAVRASKDANSIGLELMRGRMVYRTTPEQAVVGRFADAQVRSENGQDAVAIVGFRSPLLVAVTADRGTLAVTAGTERRTVSVPQGQTVEVALSDTPPSGTNSPSQQPGEGEKKKPSGAMLWTTGVVLGGGAVLGVSLWLSKNETQLTCAQKGALVSPYAFPCN
jgi:hypothetical protein